MLRRLAGLLPNRKAKIQYRFRLNCRDRPGSPFVVNVELSGLLHVAEFRHSPTEVAPLHGIRAKAQCSLVRGQRFFIPPEPAQQVCPRCVV